MLKKLEVLEDKYKELTEKISDPEIINDRSPGAGRRARRIPDPVTPSGAAQRRPTKFLADLTRAMQAAAEQARAATLEQFRGEGTAVIEQIRARSTTGATELRHHADDDVATVKEWSKSEIARIREETERRVGMRREQLEGQLERHAALVEHEVEKVRGRLAAFETEMGQFFDDLAREDDPAVFAARAANLPEPPSFDDLDEDAMTALLSEPGLGVPDVVVGTGRGHRRGARDHHRAGTGRERRSHADRANSGRGRGAGG